MKRKRALIISLNTEPYNILKDLDAIQPSILMKKLLTVTSECHSILNLLFIRCRQLNKEVLKVGLNPNLGISTINVLIDGIMISEVQVDGGSNVNLMNKHTMDALDLVHLEPTTFVLQMADHS